MDMPSSKHGLQLSSEPQSCRCLCLWVMEARKNSVWAVVSTTALPWNCGAWL